MSPDTVVITGGGMDYHGPITLLAWMFIHPWMTLFLGFAFFSAVEEGFKALGKWAYRK